MKYNVLVIALSLLSFIFIILIRPASSARILAVVPTPSYSHQVAFYPLWKELSRRGHQLKLITTNPINDSSLKNLTEVDLSVIFKEWQAKVDMKQIAERGAFGMLSTMYEIGYELLETEMQHADVKKIIQNKNERYDVVLAEAIFPAMAAFSERFKCPLIQIFSLDAQVSNYHLIGHPSHPVLNPDFMLPFSGKLNFVERLTSTAYTVGSNLWNKFVVFPSQDKLIKKYFGNYYPPLEEILRTASLIFINTDFIHPIRPLLPNVIQIGGGTHVISRKPLPKDLQKILDDAKNGVIYFSLGSNVKSRTLPQHIKNIFLETFAELPYTILWKFEEALEGRPENVFISEWYPQQDVFRHPNIKLFISQGGLQSMDEAIHNHIPIIGIPFIGDQRSNVRRIENMGFGVGLDIKTIDKPSLKNAIFEVMDNSKYRNRAKELSILSKDQPITGLERAVWWTEYVIRHKGAKHLKSPALDLPSYQYYLLDVIGFCLMIILIVIYLLFKLGKLILRLVNFFLSKEKIKTQ